ncbi:MAG TPA: hypothetical protein ENJ95_21425 [Bacteroidetes bacterium]|nr:hypothetical protein [Bacteroidota bacterium]
MTVPRTLHETAMEYADWATISKAKGKPENAARFYRIAFECEKEAADKMPLNGEDHPLPRFIMLRSTAALAYKADLYDEARQIISSTLNENPPTFIINELNDIANLIKAAHPKNNKTKPIHFKGRLKLINRPYSDLCAPAHKPSKFIVFEKASCKKI